MFGPFRTTRLVWRVFLCLMIAGGKGGVAFLYILW